MQLQPRPPRLLLMLCCLMLLFICWQTVLFSIHYHVSDIMDSLTSASIAVDFLHLTILTPVIAYILIQLFFYALITYSIYIITLSIGHYFRLTSPQTYCFGLFCLALAIANLLALNSYFFPFSFFAWTTNSIVFLWASALFWSAAIAIAFRRIGWIILTFAMLNGFCILPRINHSSSNHPSTPNIIFIGLDSVRPDFLGFYGDKKIQTPHINQFLKSAVTFDAAYTPLARTFPSWISILTAQHPKHHRVRNNLASTTPAQIETFAKKLQRAGYFTIYASDEKRFSNITTEYGFDKLAGPSMGVNDFILGSLSDFPISNLLTKLPIAKFILPYHFANRAAAITYNPTQFISQVNDVLARRPNKPLFMAVHLCLPHWPYTWASKTGKSESQVQQYRHSIEAADSQLGMLLDALKQNGALKNSIVVLLSDHGTTMGLPNDTLLDKNNYRGNKTLLKRIPISRLSSASPYSVDFKNDYTINTSYGQGTNITSLKQYRALLAFKGFGDSAFHTQSITTPVSLTDIAPTLLAILKQEPFKTADGISLLNELSANNRKTKTPRAFFTETGDSLSEIETDHVYLEKVVAKRIGIYRIDPHTGLLTMDAVAEKSVNLNKQRAIIYDDWLLAFYPMTSRNKLVPANNHSSEMKMQSFTIPAYFILVNIKTGKWTIGLNTPFARTAPVAILSKKLRDFYGDEISI